MTLPFFLALIQRTIGEPPNKHSSVSPLLWGPAGVWRGGSALILYGSEADLRPRCKVKGRQVQAPWLGRAF